MIDDEGQTILKYLGKRKATSKMILEASSPHIQDLSLMLHDGEYARRKLIYEKYLNDEVYLSSEINSYKAMQKINMLCPQIKRVILDTSILTRRISNSILTGLSLEDFLMMSLRL